MRVSHFPPQTRADALAMWRDFLPHVANYAARRNHVTEGHKNVSRLSFAIRHRLISEEEIICDTLQQMTFRSAEKWLQEICWRGYWKGWLEIRPDVWRNWRQRVEELRRSLPAEVLEKADAVAAGKSGVACMDAMASELIETGYLHNHARMWWASFWIHVEKLPWELGADFFYSHLLDADAASNTLSWRWVAGLQTSGKTYIVRIDNMKKFIVPESGRNWDGAERIADGAVTPQVVYDTADTKIVPIPAYPTSLPSVSARCGLWLHRDDLMPEIGALSELKPLSIMALGSHLNDSPPLDAAMNDTFARCATHYGCAPEMISLDEITAWVQDNQLMEVIAYAPFVGPEDDALNILSEQLKLLGVPLTLLRRESDSIVFSFSNAGFFPYWKNMSRHILQTHTS